MAKILNVDFVASVTEDEQTIGGKMYLRHFSPRR